MRTREYLANIDAVTAAFDTLASKSQDAAVPLLGKRLQRTSTFVAPAGSRPGLVLLFAPDGQQPPVVAENPSRSRLERLTEHLLGASDQTRSIIRSRSTARHVGADEEQVLRSVVNSLRRSAGTNYQGLVALALAEQLQAERSAWYIHYPPPREYMRSMAIRFTGSDGFNVDIDPDIDILVKNAAWSPMTGQDEPVVMLSVKTSPEDRAGAAVVEDAVTDEWARVRFSPRLQSELGVIDTEFGLMRAVASDSLKPNSNGSVSSNAARRSARCLRSRRRPTRGPQTPTRGHLH